MRRRLIAANWKLNGTGAFAAEYAAELVSALEGLDPAVEVAVMPPAILVPALRESLNENSGRRIMVGVQDVSAWEEGAYTGEIGASMAADQHGSFAVVGHSERRQYWAESDERINAKVLQALSAGLDPILCVGETEAEREAGETEAVVARQVRSALAEVPGADWRHVCVAYEPVWAIGTGRSATAEQAQAVHAHIREVLGCLDSAASEAPVIYGGSVKPDTAEKLFAQPDIDGGLIGGASLNASDFAAICRAG
ncbi:triose-phosphate isomerase [Salicola sp. Rm-C-2C1-2]|uniref:triose-phosphate isomerase n=1 Tax=Salicola sp. Rm-C-2C1-2 TaxID=3141321 RepID=UPI0032E40981